MTSSQPQHNVASPNQNGDDSSSESGLANMLIENETAQAVETQKARLVGSYTRTPPSTLPLPHLKAHVEPYTGERFGVKSPIVDGRGSLTGYAGSVGEVRKSEEVWIGSEVKWIGYVEHPESSERSSIRREAKMARGEAERKSAARIGSEQEIRERP